MSGEERIEALSNRSGEFFQLPPEEQTNDLYEAWAGVQTLLGELATLRRELTTVKAQSDERAARAWDKGYGAGHHDGRWHDSMRVWAAPRADRGRRNPYRFSGGAGCGCHGGAE